MRQGRILHLTVTNLTLLGWELMLRQSLESLTVPIQCSLQILVITLQFDVVNLSCVLLLFALLELGLGKLNFLAYVSQKEVLVETMNVSQLYLLLCLCTTPRVL